MCTCYDRVALRATDTELRGAGVEAREGTVDASNHDHDRAMIAATIEADPDGILAVNVKGVFDDCQEAIPAMLAGGGIIVNISSVAALSAVERRAATITSKGEPPGRLGRPEEIAWAVPYLASPEADFVHGMCLVVDVGFTAR